MKKTYHEILQLIYDNDDIGIRELASMMKRKHNDHRDFYGLTALLEAGYIGFSGPIRNKEDGSINVYEQVRLFQAYSQGSGQQTYDKVTLCGLKQDSYFYIAPKTIEYFHSRSETRIGLYFTAGLAIISSIISSIIVSYLAAMAK